MSKYTLLLALLLALVLLPTVSAQDSTYTLKYGDYLEAIAITHDLDVACLAEASSIDNPNKLRPGDTLIIDRTCPPYGGEPEADQTIDDEEPAARASATTDAADYVVKRGDVLDTIAAAFDVDIQCLAEVNAISNGRIYVGDALEIDLSCPPYTGLAPVNQPRENAAADGQGGGGNNYTVRVGDVLDTIAAQLNVDTACLAEANTLSNPGRIFPGDSLKIPTHCSPYAGLALNTNP